VKSNYSVADRDCGMYASCNTGNEWLRNAQRYY